MNKLGKGFNRVFSLVLIMALLVSAVPVVRGVSSVWNGKVATGFAGGTGTEDDPYLIQTAEELAYLAASVNGGNTYEDAYIRLEADIVLNDTTDWESWDSTAPANEWTPIGGSNHYFSGVFDGGGHAVAGVYINTTAYNVGLFGVIDSGTVINLGVIDSYIHSAGLFVGGVCGSNNGTLIWCDNAGTVTGIYEYVGGVCGSNSGTVTECYNTGAISGNNHVGGVCGHTSGGTIAACYNAGAITADRQVGGVCGYNATDSTVAGCYNTGTVTGNWGHIGGVCGLNENSIVVACYNTGTVTSSEEYIGGVCGKNWYGTVAECYNTGAVAGCNNVGGVCGENSASDGAVAACYNTGTVTGTKNVGGVCGLNRSAILTCYNTGTLTGEDTVGGVCGLNKDLLVACYNMGALTGDRNVGGVCGENLDSAGIADCYNAGTVTGNEEYIGGVCGLNHSVILTCYNTGAVKGKKSVGGVCASSGDDSYIGDCYYLNTSCTGGDLYATALTNAQMRVASNFDGFDFESEWFLDPAFAAHPYPILREMPFNPMLGFADVSTSRYYYDAVMWAAKNGITTGVDETHFAPNADCTRAQAVMFLWNAAGCPTVSENVKNPFEDVKEGRYYYDAVLWAVSVGITDGTDATHFSPNEKLNRATFVTFLWRAVGEPEVPVTDTFTDVQSDKFYATAVAWAVAAGITDGITATTFAPNQLCSRAQVVTFLHRALT